MISLDYRSAGVPVLPVSAGMLVFRNRRMAGGFGRRISAGEFNDQSQRPPGPNGINPGGSQDREVNEPVQNHSAG